MSAQTESNVRPLREQPIMQPHEWDVLRQLRGLTGQEYDQVLVLISSFKRGLDTPPPEAA